MNFPLDRRQFLLGSAATGALAMSGCAGMAPRTDTAAAHATYDSIFEGMLRISPETATGLGIDTGERAYLKSRLSDSGPAGRSGAYRAIVDHLPQLRRIDRAALAPREQGWLDT
ncbi:MAG TPA: twin-arginine translocation signal domain-containing protein, partial [Allosphingosinicella sp.]|nr:twin-arginine translocation signal domain-containing protein [Allosphingosinicella sp.]